MIRLGLDMKRKILILSCLAILLAIASFGTLAYFSVAETAEQVVTAGNVELKIRQEGEISGNEIEIMPGDLVDNTTSVENIGDHPLFLRVKITMSVAGEDKLPAIGIVELSINKAAWTWKDGYYYYMKEVEPDGMTEPLFETVGFNGPAMDNRYIGKKLLLQIDAYGVQSENNGTDPLLAMGWPSE